MKTRSKAAFTLVELLVVIGIIALLISILLPSLSRARQTAVNIKCESNLRAIGQGVAIYVSVNNGYLPPSNEFAGMQLRNGQQYGPGGTRAAADIWSLGYIHWSALIFTKAYDVNDPAFRSPDNWAMFQCPALDKGGVAPCNTYPANQDPGLVNEAPGQLDAQAPRLGYMMNEALTPRGRFGLGVPGSTIKHVYHFVNAGHVKNSAGTILATENWGISFLMTTKDQITGLRTASNSRRPVSAVSVSLSQANGAGLGALTADSLYTATDPDRFVAATPNQVIPDPSGHPNFVNANIETTLDFVGRNHGTRSLGTVQGPSGAVSGWDTRTTNFLYLDGHVESKNLAETISPKSEWGDRFYDLVQD